jgi:hypothetical protein
VQCIFGGDSVLAREQNLCRGRNDTLLKIVGDLMTRPCAQAGWTSLRSTAYDKFYGEYYLIHELVESFRHALIEELNEANFVDAELSSFPYGSCEITSHMLGIFLESKGISKVVITRNGRDDSIHYWVVIDNKLIVDLTAHQFSEHESDCIVSEDSSFHENYKRIEEYKPNRCFLNRRGSLYGYTNFYDNIVSRLE